MINIIECSLEDLYNFIRDTNEDITKIKVNTRKGFYKINGIDITAKNSEQIELKTYTGKKIIGSPDHLLWINNTWSKIKDAKINDDIEVIDGIDKIEFLSLLDYKEDLYDIEVDEIKEYYANNIVSHNSTIANVIKYLIYGKVDSVNLTDIPNRVNKNLWGKIKIKSNSIILEIERGINPNIFKVWINGKEYDQAGKINVQDMIEREILEIPFIVFKNIIVLSTDGFKSLLNMNPGDKKNIIDKIFGWSIINEMRENLKREKKTLEIEIRDLERDLIMIDESIKSVLDKITELEKDDKTENLKIIKEEKEKLQSYVKEKDKLSKAVDKINNFILNIEKEEREDNKQYVELRSELKDAERKIQFYENSSCPTCGSSLDTDFHHHIKDDNLKIVKKLPKQITEIEVKLQTVLNKKRESSQMLNKIIIKTSSIDYQINDIKKRLLAIVNGDKGKDKFDHLENIVNESKSKEQKKAEEKTVKDSESYFLQSVDELLGDDGIKNLAMKIILPVLNKNISDMAKEVHLPFKIEFDEKFNANVKSLGEKVNPNSLSKGERKRADLIIILAMIKWIKLRYSGLNILFLDEIFSGLDTDGIYTILKVLKNITTEINLNTFVINHTVLPSELFQKKIDIAKTQGFSDLVISDLN